jgi:hypothetical protein
VTETPGEMIMDWKDGRASRRLIGPSTTGNGPSSDRGTTEPDLVPVRIQVRGLAHTIRVGLPSSGRESACGDLGEPGVEVVDEERVHGTMYRYRCSATSHTASISFGRNEGGEPSNLSYQFSASL